ncbi:ankyrin repeat-containing domain protein [Mycena olivaceomarginata]|nr:ankyrin repeat-containing domain protein [Mycena olivaceomarginata]
MAGLTDLPPELILRLISFLTYEKILDKNNCLIEQLRGSYKPVLELVPDLPSINSLSQTTTIFHRTLDETLYKLCASVETLGQRALLFAVEHQLENAVERLVEVGVSLHTNYGFEHLNWGSVLHIAAAMGFRDMVVKLLGMCGEEMVHKRADGRPSRTPLDYAARHNHLEIVKLLAPIPVPGSSTPIEAQYLNIALLAAVQGSNVEISEYLVSEGADVNFLDLWEGGTPLSHAAATKNLGLVQFLISAGADPNLHQSSTSTIPLFNAIFTHNLEIVQALVAAGADIHILDQRRDQRNVLVYCETVELLRFFLERGVDPNFEDRGGNTPLHLVCARAKTGFAVAAVELLLRFGAAATVEKPGQYGLTPVDIAVARYDTETLELLEPHVQDPDLKRKIAARWKET